jgi:hypothetical protein
MPYKWEKSGWSHLIDSRNFIDRAWILKNSRPGIGHESVPERERALGPVREIDY